MIPAPIPSDEEARLAAIEHYRLEGVGRENVFDHITELAVCAFRVPISLVTIVGSAQQCFRGAHGLPLLSTDRDVSFCGHAIIAPDIFVIPDALHDKRFADNPLVRGEPYIRFYAGAPLRLKDGSVPGTLCLIDRKPRVFDADQREELARLARLVVDVIELRLDGIIAEERHQALVRMQNAFISATSHELRTPLTSISASLGLLQAGASDGLPEQARRLIAIAHANSKRLVALVNDILDIDKLSAGQVEFDCQPLIVASVLQDSVDANAAYAADHGVALVIEPVPEQLLVDADHHRLLQVLTNLLSNAIKFSNRGESVILGARALDGHVRITVSDSGRGIPEDFRERIFTRFAQAELADSRDKGGTGLGLAIVKEIVERMSGNVGFDTEVGEGTSFHVDLPQHLGGGAGK